MHRVLWLYSSEKKNFVIIEIKFMRNITENITLLLKEYYIITERILHYY